MDTYRTNVGQASTFSWTSTADLAVSVTDGLETSTIDELINERDELLRENQSLRQENQEMAELLAEYERGMEATTELIRDHAVLSLFSPSSNIV